MKSLKGKKLLVISSDSSDLSFVEAAKDMGVYVICCDRYSDWKISPAKEAADAAWNIDYTDTESVVEMCRREGVNGVIAGYGEDRVMAACRISNAIGAPFYATEEQINITRNKRHFKKLCNQYGVLTPAEYCYELPMSEEDLRKIHYPVIVKPSDNGGRKGISVCENEVQLMKAIAIAVEESKMKEIIVEEYLKGLELCAVYTMADGNISLSCLNDKYISEDQGASRLCDVAITPSKFYEKYVKEVDGNIKALLNGIGAKNGVANFQFIANENGIKAFEMGYRVNGNDDFKVIRKYNDIDFVKMLICYSLTGTMGDTLDKDNPVFSQYSCTVCLYLHSGEIGKIDYSDLIAKDGIDDICIHIKEGRTIIENGTSAQKAGMIKLSAKSMSEIIELIHYVRRNVTVEDIEGRNMLLMPFNTDRLLEA